MRQIRAFTTLSVLALVGSLCSPSYAQGGTPPAFDPAAVLGEGKDQVTTFLVASAPVVIGLLILGGGFRWVMKKVRSGMKSA